MGDEGVTLLGHQVFFSVRRVRRYGLATLVLATTAVATVARVGGYFAVAAPPGTSFASANLEYLSSNASNALCTEYCALVHSLHDSACDICYVDKVPQPRGVYRRERERAKNRRACIQNTR